ncbi:MAG: NUDIX domain-containing protein [Clostridium sp.]|jgi:8-oxo-dGTP pyrophosphatase MutT (NUDIX family)|nr:NUDIX domain-containing protein [Clostridium sp.]
MRQDGSILAGVNITIGEPNIPANVPIKMRVGVRGVAVNQGKLLMIIGNHGYYSFAGGGIEPGETIEEAVRREMLEETGYSVACVSRILGIEQNYKISRVIDNVFYHMIYYICECHIDMNSQAMQQLETHEAAAGLRCAWVKPQDAIKQNCAVGVVEYNREIEIMQIAYNQP